MQEILESLVKSFNLSGMGRMEAFRHIVNADDSQRKKRQQEVSAFDLRGMERPSAGDKKPQSGVCLHLWVSRTSTAYLQVL